MLRGWARPATSSIISFFLLSVGPPRDQHAPVETGEILGWASWQGGRRRGQRGPCAGRGGTETLNLAHGSRRA